MSGPGKQMCVSQSGSVFDTLRRGRIFLVYLFIGFAGISYGRFIDICCKFERSTYIQEPLVIGRRGCVQGEI
jgi:hypothetical protein